MFDGRFVRALDQSFYRLFPKWLNQTPVITLCEAQDYSDHGFMYLMGTMIWDWLVDEYHHAD
jgi:drug/metabolite transporter superfamily protein YnfA